VRLAPPGRRQKGISDVGKHTNVRASCRLFAGGLDRLSMVSNVC
jgi:hypothetical protein